MNMDKHELKERVLLNLRSVTQSCKGGVPFDRLQRDYKDLLGSPIPYRDLGFDSLEKFIRSIPNVISLKRDPDGQLVAAGVADASTAHIVNMVSKQKTDTKKRPFRKPAPHFSMRKTLTQRFAFREGSRTSHSSYNSSASHFPARSSTKPRQISPKHAPSRPLLPKPVPPKQMPPKPMPPKPMPSKPMASKPSSNYSNSKSGSSRYEVPPRFSRLQNQNRNPSPPPVEDEKRTRSPVRSPSPVLLSQARVPSPVHLSSSLSTDDHWDIIPPPVIPPPQPTRSLPSQPKHFENTRFSQQSSLESASSPKEFIEVYAKMNNICVVYKTNKIGQKAKNQGYVSKLILGDRSYPLYPNSRSTAEAAEQAVAEIAMEDVKKNMQEQINSISETPYGTPEEIRQLLGRIEEIVCEKPSGMFENGIINEYETKYNERLPSCWPDLLKQSSFVEKEDLNLVNGIVPKGATFIVKPTKEFSSGNRTPSSTSSKNEKIFDGFDAPTLKKNLVDISYPKVPDFILPTGNIWFVFVTNISGNISVRLVDYNDDFLDLSEKMSQFYKMNHLPVAEVLEHHMYAFCADDSPDIWHRVLIDSMEEDGSLSCYFVDEGEFMYINKEGLQEINPAFLKLPFQAIHFALDGLETFQSNINPELLEERLLAQTLVAEVKRSKKVPEFFPDIPGIHRTVYIVTLYDTSDPSGEDLNLNELFKESLKESFVCELPKLHTSSFAYLSHVTADGQVYLRFTNPQECLIEKEMENFFPVFEEAASKSPTIAANTMCAAKYESGTWHRAMITENQYALDPETVEVFFVDYGHLSVVGKNEICELKPISDLLASIPPQAICCELLNALPSPTSLWTEKAIAKLLDLAPFEQELIIRVMNEDDGENLAKVNLFKRNENNDIISLNMSLACDPSLFNDPSTSLPTKAPTKLPLQPRKSSFQNSLSSAIPDVAIPAEQAAKRLMSHSKSSEELKWLNTPDDIKSPGAFDIQSPIALDIVTIPEVGSIFDVFVTMAAHPLNFIVQPFQSAHDLTNLMNEMNTFYSFNFATENQLEMDVSMIRKNEFYAALHTDGSWYRIRVEDIIPSKPIMVAAHFVDFGDFNQVNLSNIQLLYHQFKSLPCQAVQASLFGIKPYESDWRPEDCVEFQQMVTEKTFSSIVQSKTTQKKNDIPNHFVELTLIDVSDPVKDVYIHDLLIEKKIARPLR